MAKKLNIIGVMTAGGDAPGMNPAIRAVVRTAVFHGVKVFGVEKGWYGAINDHIHELTAHSVSGIINRGGTFLHTKRCPEFKEKNNRHKAVINFRKYGIEGLVVIGGDGSMRASVALINDFKLPINVVPASIDNDIPGTDFTIGFDTAVNTAMEAIDKIRDTADSHERLFVIEVMGRHNGFIAADVALVCGAEIVIIPEVKHNIEAIAAKINKGRQRGKESFIVVVAEGAESGSSVRDKLAKRLPDMDIRVSVLGHIQRGGSPSAFSRELAGKLGATAAELLIHGKSGLLVGTKSDRVNPVPLNKVGKLIKKIELEQLRIAEMLSV
ncbi:MAG: 6-phosphofructokinase [Candidatus Margulisbacteria bacterium]|nr:6-phosphofructokinase [Candidatus Margulisiibacteriota bacterium]MBU1617647.1 6-phosphofructokinase [Candidatus Margulisiibacteriota bacterium]MBU1867585.1 6-phosphofructokinase [Candidatus Margulisiibacteriota bacterium]